ncbi:MAG TPA: urease accessory UreF family protein [Tepidisphaeraceae bacterium]|nr:urease accessory UreF family protein [Tepidisphaeraceae bacterium]
MNDWIIWQIADSAFPIGGFAHSAGLEAAWRGGEIPSPAALHGFLHSALHQCAGGLLPIALIAFREAPVICHADELCDLFLNHPVPNRASRAMGRALISTMRQIHPAYANVDLPPTHFAPALGLICRRLSLPEIQLARLLLHMTLRSTISAAIRLGIIGPLAGQSIQLSFAPLAESLSRRALGADPEDIAQTSPIADLFQGCHDRLYSRLFQS